MGGRTRAHLARDVKPTAVGRQRHGDDPLAPGDLRHLGAVQPAAVEPQRAGRRLARARPEEDAGAVTGERREGGTQRLGTAISKWSGAGGQAISRRPSHQPSRPATSALPSAMTAARARRRRRGFAKLTVTALDEPRSACADSSSSRASPASRRRVGGPFSGSAAAGRPAAAASRAAALPRGSRSRIFTTVGGRVAGEGRPAGQALEEDAAEGPDVGAAVDRTTPRLLGAHVGDGAEHGPRREVGEHAGRRVVAAPAPTTRRPPLARPKSSSLATPPGVNGRCPA